MPLELNRIRALCFDVDGTLSDTDDQWLQRTEQLLSPLRWFLPSSKLHRLARWLVMGIETPGNFAYYVLDRLGIDDEMARFFSFVARSRLNRRKHRFWLIPGVRQMLLALAEHYPLSIVSARGQQGTMDFLNQFGLESLFVSVVTAQTCSHTKPFPDPVLHAAQEMGVPPQACLMIGDTTMDIRAGRAAGAQTVGVLCGFGEEAELRRAGANLILPSTADLAETLLGVKTGGVY